MIILALQFFCWSIGVYGFVLWLPSILKAGLQMNMVEAGWLSSLPYLAAVIGMLVVSWASDKAQKRKRFVWPPLLIASVAFYASYLLGPSISGGPMACWWSPALACTRRTVRSLPSFRKSSRPMSPAAPWR